MARRPKPPFEAPFPPPATDAGSEVDRARLIAVKLLAAHGWSIAAMRARLIKRGISEGAAEAAIESLVRAGFLGDAKFAEETARLEQSRKPAADMFIRRKLRTKGVDAKTASNAATTAAEGATERDRALALARKSVRPGKDDAATRRRLFGVLARRGFDAEIAQEAVDKVLGEAPEPPDNPHLEDDHEPI